MQWNHGEFKIQNRSWDEMFLILCRLLENSVFAAICLLYSDIILWTTQLHRGHIHENGEISRNVTWTEPSEESEYHVSDITGPGDGDGERVLVLGSKVSPLFQRTTDTKSQKCWKKNN